VVAGLVFGQPPALTLAWRERKLVLMKQRPGAATAEALQRAMAALQGRRADEAERIAAGVLAREPRNPRALHVRGLALLSQGRPREAAAFFEQAAALVVDAAVETYWGIALRLSGQAERSLEVLRRAVTREPVFPLAFHELGVVLFQMRRLDEAQATLERGLKHAPAMPELSVMLGGICLERADWASAKLTFARVLANAPGQPAALFGLGTALMEEGEFASAAERFQHALARDPGYNQARMRLAGCLFELDRRDEAIACLRAAVKAEPQRYGDAVRTLVSTARGRFWLKPSAAAAMLKPSE
jgi:tetratricopeptide (TPR) repeat protein